MIRVNLTNPLFFGPKLSFTEYMVPRVIGRGPQSSRYTKTLKYNFKPVNGSIAPLSPELRDALMGKAPLRLVSARCEVEQGVWEETLECGHKQTAFTGFFWDDGAHLVNVPPSAKRRRCQPCKAISLGLKKPVQSSPISRSDERCRMTMSVVCLEPKDVKKCKGCNADIAFLKSKAGKWYVVNADYALDGKPATFKTNFHRCPARKAVA